MDIVATGDTQRFQLITCWASLDAGQSLRLRLLMLHCDQVGKRRGARDVLIVANSV